MPNALELLYQMIDQWEKIDLATKIGLGSIIAGSGMTLYGMHKYNEWKKIQKAHDKRYALEGEVDELIDDYLKTHPEGESGIKLNDVRKHVNNGVNDEFQDIFSKVASISKRTTALIKMGMENRGYTRPDESSLYTKTPDIENI